MGVSAVLGTAAVVNESQANPLAFDLATSGRALRVSEIFGPTIQGEGISIGVPAMFVRVAGCPLSCTWCDTAYSWDWSRFDRGRETALLSVEEIWDDVVARAGTFKVKTLVLTGGEPASQSDALEDLARRAIQVGWRIEVETAGAVRLGTLAKLCDVITVSPKLRSSGMPAARRILLPVLEEFASYGQTQWKFVVQDEADLRELDALVSRLQLNEVMVMPQAQTPGELSDAMRQLVPAAIERGYRVSTRLHIELWSGERGR